MNLEEEIKLNEKMGNVLFMIRDMKIRHELNMDSAYGKYNVSMRSRKKKAIAIYKAEISQMAVDRLIKYYNNLKIKT